MSCKAEKSETPPNVGCLIEVSRRTVDAETEGRGLPGARRDSASQWGDSYAAVARRKRALIDRRVRLPKCEAEKAANAS